MIYSFDIDQTIATTQGNDYPRSLPKPETVALINILFEKGHTIKIFTGRGSKSGADWRILTENQLKQWGVKYHELIMGKPNSDYFVDDKNLSLFSLNCVQTPLIDTVVQCFRKGNKVLVAGNGGLCAESSHFAAELMGKFAFELYAPCIALTTDTSLITAVANDMGYENVFAHQVGVLGQEGDIFIGMTTSQSKNILKACETAKELGLTTILVCSKKYELHADYLVRLDGEDTAIIQNNAIQFLHALAYSVKKVMWDGQVC